MTDDNVMLTDFHSHILPGIDDGSRNTEESLQLLDMLKAQCVKTVVATPHFDVNTESIDSFVKRRRLSYEHLMDSAHTDMPEIMLGAEVVYYPGISRFDDIERLCIENTNLLLLEMPLDKWSKYTVDELVNMTATRGVRVIVAHVERCLNNQDKLLLEHLYHSDVLFQINASAIISISTRRRILAMLKDGRVHLLGSDCHNMRSRPPRIGEAYKILEKRLGSDFVHDMARFGRSLITD